jgi:hypothetical protein
MLNGTYLRLAAALAAHHGQPARADSAALLLERLADSTQSRADRLAARIAAAHASLARADTAQAIERLAALRPSAPRAQIAWSTWEPLAHERLLLARLLAATGRREEADQLAASLASGAASAHVMFARPALELRRELARARNDTRAERRFQAALAALNPPGDRQP